MHFSVMHWCHSMHGVRYTVQRRLFLCSCIWSVSLLENFGENFCVGFQDSNFQVNKVYTTWSVSWEKTGSLLDKKPDGKLIVLTDDKLDAIHVRLEAWPKKSQTTSSARRATLLNLLPYMTAVVRVLEKHHLFLRIHSGSTKKEHLLRDFNNFWNKRLPRVYWVY